MTAQEARQALRPGVGAMVSFTISEQVDELKARPEWSARDRLGVSLVKDDALNLLLMVLKKGAHLKEHRTKGPIAVHVLSGAIRFSVGPQVVELASGKIAALDRDIPHSFEALEESVVLLITAID
jgi:quercetin dioxygenase-like cupin family protein